LTELSSDGADEPFLVVEDEDRQPLFGCMRGGISVRFEVLDDLRTRAAVDDRFAFRRAFGLFDHQSPP
jgi:hypothetical protein